MHKNHKRDEQSINKVSRDVAKSEIKKPGVRKTKKSSINKTTLSSKKDRYESIVLSILRSVHHSIDLQEVLNNAAKALRDNIDVVDHVAIFLVEDQEAVMRAYGGHPSWFVKRVSRIPYPKGLTWKTIIERKPIYCDDVDKDTAIGPAGRKVGIKSYLSIPINYEDKTIGCINVHSSKKNAFDQEDIRLLEIVTQQIEIAINHAKRAEELKTLYDELNDRNKDLEILNTITLAVHKFLDIEEVYKVALDMTEVLENVDMTMIYLVDEDRKEAVLKAYRNLPKDYLSKASRIPYPKGVTWKVINSGKNLNIENAQNSPNIGPAGKQLGHHGILGIPITLGKKTTGVIWFCSYKERVFDNAEVDLLTSIGNQIAIAVAKADLYKELTRKNRYESIVSLILRNIHQSIDLQEVLDNAVEAISENIDGIEYLGIYMVEGEEAVLKSHKGLPDWFYKKIRRLPYPKGYIWNTIIEGKSKYVADVTKDSIIGPAGRKFGTKSYLCVPIHNKGKTVGVLGISSLIKDAFEEEELKVLETVASQIEIAVTNARQAEALKNSEEIAKENLDQLFKKNRYDMIIASVLRSVHKSIDLQEVLDNAVESLIENVDRLDIAAIYLVEGKEAVLKAQSGCTSNYLQNAGRIPYPKGTTWKTIIKGKPRYVADIDKDKNVGPAGRALGMKSYLSVPINFRGKTVGTLNLVSFKKNAFDDEEEVKLLEIVAQQIEIAINNARQAETIRQSEEAMRQNLSQLSKKNRYEIISSSVLRSVHQSIDLEHVLDNAVDSMSKNLEKVDVASIYLVEGKDAVLKAHRGCSKAYIKRAGRIPYPKGVTWNVIKEDKPRYMPDVDKDRVIGAAGKESGVKSYLTVPIHFQDKAVGTLNLNSFTKNAFDEEERNLLENVAKQIDIAINNAQQADALRDSEERFRTIADTAPVMIWLSRPDNVKTYFNKVWLEFTGRTMEQEVGAGWAEGVHPDDMERSTNTIVSAYEAEEEFKIEFRLRRFDGEYRWILAHAIPRSHADGSFAGFIGSCVDITEHKQIEEDLEYKKKDLLSTFNSMANGVITTNTKGSITFMNSLAQSLTGWNKSEAINKSLARVLKIKDKEKKKLIKIPREMHFKEETNLSLPSQALLIDKSSKETPIHIGISKLKDEEGNISGNVFMLRETTWDMPNIDSSHSEGSQAYAGNSAATPVSLMIGASSIIVLEGVSRILESAQSIDQVARTSDPLEIIPLLIENGPDVLFFDTALPSPDIEVILKSIKEHNLKTKLLLLIQDLDEKSIIDSVSLGARGCIAEPSNSAQLIQAIQAVGNGEIWIGVGLVTKILTRLIPQEKVQTAAINPDLTQKEEEIVKLVSQGLGNKQISKKLYITEITVKTHLRNIFRKLGIRSRYEIVKKFGN